LKLIADGKIRLSHKAVLEDAIMAEAANKTTPGQRHPHSNAIRMPHVRSVSMGVWVNVGARDETLAENGLSHFIEHMIFKGTERRSAYDIAKEFDAIGGHTNAFTVLTKTPVIMPRSWTPTLARWRTSCRYLSELLFAQ
jgi:hypothetical protein